MIRSDERTPFRAEANWSKPPSYSLLAGIATPFEPRPPGIVDEAANELEGMGDENLPLAATYLRAAMTRGRPVGHLRSNEALADIQWYYSFAVQACVWFALLGLLGLAFAEDGPDVLPAFLTGAVEVVCLGVLVVAASFERSFMGPAFFKEPSCVFHTTVLGLICAEFVATAVGLPGSATYRYARALRPLLLLHYSPHLRERLIDLLRVSVLDFRFRLSVAAPPPPKKKHILTLLFQ